MFVQARFPYASKFAGNQDSPAHLLNTNPEASAVPRQAWLHGKSASNGRRKLGSFVQVRFSVAAESGAANHCCSEQDYNAVRVTRHGSKCFNVWSVCKAEFLHFFCSYC